MGPDESGPRRRVRACERCEASAEQLRAAQAEAVRLAGEVADLRRRLAARDDQWVRERRARARAIELARKAYSEPPPPSALWTWLVALKRKVCDAIEQRRQGP